MKKNIFKAFLILTMASMLLSIPLYSQDKVLLSRADSLHRQGLDLVESQNYEGALILFEKAAEIRKEQQGDSSSDFANSINNIGICYLNLENYPMALDYLQKALGIREKVLGKEHSDYANTLDDIGYCYYSQDDYTTALEFFQKSLSIRETIQGCNHPDYINDLEVIGRCYYFLEEEAKAVPYFQKVLGIIKTDASSTSEHYIYVLLDIVRCFYYLEQYETALDYFQQAISIDENVLTDYLSFYADLLDCIGVSSQAHNDFSKALEYHQRALSIYGELSKEENIGIEFYHIGYCNLKIGEYTDALEMFQKALALFETCYGKDSKNYSDCLLNIANCYNNLRDYSEALKYLLQSLSAIEATAKDGIETLYRLTNIGHCLQSLNNFSEASDYYYRALDICEKTLGKDNRHYAINLTSIGNCYSNLGNYTKALEFCRQAETIFEKVSGKESVDYAGNLKNIADCYRGIGDHAKQLVVLQDALHIYEKSLGKEHPLYAGTLNNIGVYYIDVEEYAKALEYINQATKVYETTYGKDHPLYAMCLNNIGYCYQKLNDYTHALYYYSEVLTIRDSLYGKVNQSSITTIGNVISCYKSLHDYSNVVKYVIISLEATSSLITHSFSLLTESQRTLFWEKYSSIFTNTLFDYAANYSSPEMNSYAYDGALFGKGLLLNAETEMRKLVLESGDEEALRAYNDIQASRIKLDKLYENPVGKKEAIDSLNNDIETRQQELMKRSKVFGDYTRNLALKWTDVQSALGKKDIAIEFETYTHQDTTFYIALTLRSGYTEPHLVELFNSTQMKAKSDSKTYYTSTAMSELVWGNLAEELNGVKNVYFSPAGELNNIGIEYMLDEDGKHLLSEKRNYYRLTSTRELAKEHQSNKMSDATIYGGIRYDVTPGSKLTGEETESERLALAATRSYTPMDSLSVTRGGWKYLPGTKEEAESISSTLTSKRVKNELLEGAAGTEESFKALGGARKDVIHIATHGFYWTETEAGRSGMETSSFMLDGESTAPKEDKALTRSGLLFAGAQNTFDGKEIPIDVEDGILTAKDISRMDLRGTDLVVISACQSGLGEVTGDGVFGLQRGFKKAGVQSIVMSLWEVDDIATKVMMTRFYENLAKGKSKYDAFLEAQKYLRKYVDEEGRTYDEPEYYAAFVLLDAIK